MTTTDQRKDLPPVTAPNFLEKVREALNVYMGNRGDPLDQGLTKRDLEALGSVTTLVDNRIQDYDSGSTISPADGSMLPFDPGPDLAPDLTPPPAPTGFTASAGITTILISCGGQNYSMGHGHSKSRLYGAKWVAAVPPAINPALPTFDSAHVLTPLLTEFSGSIFSYSTDPATTWHLWLTWVTVDGVEGQPAGGINGVVVTTGQDVALLLKALTGEITASQLYTDLGARINLIDGSGAGSVTQRLASQFSALQGAYVTADSTTYTSAVVAANTYTASYSYSKSAVDGAIAAAGSSLTSAYTTADGAVLTTANGYVNTYAYSKSAADGAISTNAGFLRSYSNLGSKTFRQTSAPTKRGVDPQTSADIALQTGDLWIDTDDGNKQNQWNGSSWVYSPDGAIAAVDSRVTDVNTTKIGYATKAGAAFDGDGSTVVYSTASYPTVDYPAYALNRTLIIDALGVAGWNALHPSSLATWNIGLPLARAVKQVSVSTVAGAYRGGVSDAALTTSAAVTAWNTAHPNDPAVWIDANTAALEQRFTAQQATNGKLLASYSVKIDIGGKVAGFALDSGAGSTSNFAIRADRFYIAPPETGAGSATTQIMPFIVQTSAATASNGTPIPAGVYIDTGFIKNATITSAQIASVKADSIQTGVMQAVVSQTGAIFSGVAAYTFTTNATTGVVTASRTSYSPTNSFGTGYYLGVLDGAPTFFVGSDTNVSTSHYLWWNSAGTLRVKGHIEALSGWIGGNILDGTGIKSPNYSAGTAGWKIKTDGTAEFAAASIRGLLTASQIDTRNLTIKDAAGNVLFGAGTALNFAALTGTASTSQISGLGTLATQNSVTSGQVSGLGSLATQNSVTAGQVSGLGSLATLNYSTIGENVKVWNGSAMVTVGVSDFVSNLSKISSGNISTFIDGAAIGTAYIGDLAVNSLKIGNNAVTIPFGIANSYININVYAGSSNHVGDSSWSTINVPDSLNKPRITAICSAIVSEGYTNCNITVKLRLGDAWLQPQASLDVFSSSTTTSVDTVAVTMSGTIEVPHTGLWRLEVWIGNDWFEGVFRLISYNCTAFATQK
jgi:hypothetical protein